MQTHLNTPGVVNTVGPACSCTAAGEGLVYSAVSAYWSTGERRLDTGLVCLVLDNGLVWLFGWC